jgi:hypothetical protein
MLDILFMAGALFVAQGGTAAATGSPAAAGDTRRECRVFGETGSRLARRRICATRAEWVENDRVARQRITDNQTRQIAPVFDDRVNNSTNQPTVRCGRC